MAAKKEQVSLEEAAEAFILLHDSGNYNGRRYDRVLGMLRDAVKGKSNKNVGPIVPEPEDMRPELDEEQQAYAEELIHRNVRVDDMTHPGGRLQKARESVDTILKKAEEGTLAQDEARRTAALAKESARERGAETAEENAEREARVQAIAAGEEPPKATTKKKGG